jgi:signal transduction histidine kinase
MGKISLKHLKVKMINEIILFVCEDIKPEIEEIIRSERYNNLLILTYPSWLNLNEDQKKRIKTSEKVREKSIVIVIMSEKSSNQLEQYGIFKHKDIYVKRVEECARVFIPKNLYRYYKQENFLIMNTGQFLLLYDRLSENSFNLDTITQKFDKKKPFLILDTKIDNNLYSKLEELQSKTNLQYKVIPVGLEQLSYYIDNIIKNYRLQKQKSLFLKKIAESNKVSANYEMTFDLIKRLTSLKEEKEVFQHIFNIYESLFAPKKLISVFYKDEEIDVIKTKPSNLEVPQEEINGFKALDKDYLLFEDKNGFYIKISYNQNLLSIIKIQEVEFPEYIHRYLDPAISVANICGLAISNARYYQKLNNTLNKLKKSNEQLEEFAYVVSHDLKQPLSTIIGYLSLLKKTFKKKIKLDASELVDNALKGAKNMNQMIDDLLDYSRLGKVRGFEKCDLNELIKVVKRNLREAIESSNAEIIYSTFPEIYGNKFQIIRLFQNLIDNAIKYRDGVDNPKIEISYKEKDNKWIFSVSDNGKGIPSEELDNIFKPFYRLERNKSVSGTGIGLSICKKITEIHGGDMWVESELGKGTTFYFTISQKKQ